MADHEMPDQDKDKQLDDLLESLLSSYSVAEPRMGLETRIQALVRDAAPKRRPWLWNLGWLGAGAMAIVAILLVVYASRTIAPPHRTPLEAGSPFPQPTRVAVVPKRTIKNPDRSQKVSRLVPENMYTLAVKDRPAVFPTPVGLSDQEKLFLRYLAGTPRDEVIAQSHSDEVEVVDGLPDDQSALPGTARQLVTNGTQ
jgi:hypothetical protein